MAGYQTIEALRPILHRGPPQTPVLDRALFYKPRNLNSPTFQDVQTMVALREQGVSQLAIARQTGFARTTVQRHTGHVPPPPGGWNKGGQHTKLNKAFAGRLKRAGFTYREIAEELGCHCKSVENLLKGHPSVLRKGGLHRPSEYFEKVVSEVSGFTVQQLRRSDTHSQRGTGDKARLILQWLVRYKRPGLSYAEIAKHLGGYDPSTCKRAFYRVQPIFEFLGLPLDTQTKRLVERLYKAEWPKASI